MITVLAYHAVGELGDDPVTGPYSVTVRELTAHLDALRRWRFSFLGLDDLLAVVGAERRAPRRGVLLSFDDGYADLAHTVAPLLRAYDAPAVTFAVAGRLGLTNTWDTARGARTLDLLDAAALRSLARAGIETGAHSRTHPDLTTLDGLALRQELARDVLTEARAFAYPYGAVSPPVVDAVRDAGYEVAFTLRPATIRAGANPFTLPRVQIRHGDGVPRLALKLAYAHTRR